MAHTVCLTKKNKKRHQQANKEGRQILLQIKVVIEIEYGRRAETS